MKYNVKFLEKEKDPLAIERELGITHTPFELELAIFNAIRNGDKKSLKEATDNYFSYGFVIGAMSEDRLREIKYWSVSTISLATHYAILGGLDETDAYNLSDEFIQKIDTMTDINHCIDYMKEKSLVLADMVYESGKYSKLVSSVRHYIHIHLYEKITEPEIEKALGYSRDMLYLQFKKETGITIHQFILKEKIQESIRLMSHNITSEEAAYTLGFSSQTHFTECFKKIMGTTPLKYMKKKE